MDPIAIAAIAIAANIIVLLALAAWATYQAEKARTAGYDEGYEASARVGQSVNDNLEFCLQAAQKRISELQLERDSITQNADRRIALYAGQSFVTEDIKLLLTAATHLKTAAETYRALSDAILAEPARAAHSAGEGLTKMVARIQQQLEGAEPAAITLEASA